MLPTQRGAEGVAGGAVTRTDCSDAGLMKGAPRRSRPFVPMTTTSFVMVAPTEP